MDKQIVLLIISMAIVSYIPRALPLVAFNKINFPPTLVKWLSFIPVAVLAALLTPDLFIFQGSVDLSMGKINFLASLLTLTIALVTRSMVWSLIAGMGSYALLKMLLM